MYTLGQVILYKDGPNIISKLIRLIEGNKITHCAIVIEEDILDPLLLEIENSSSKVRVVKLSATLNYTDEIYTAINPNIKIVSEIPSMSSFLYQLLGKKYSIKSLINSSINHFLGRIIKNYTYKEYFKSTNKYTCASLVAEVLLLLSNYKTNNITLIEPDDFTKAPWIVTRIK